MTTSEIVREYLNSSSVDGGYQIGDYEKAPAALPDASIQFLKNMCSSLHLTNIFEFGSGRSTKAFLELGCFVTSLEDSGYWINETLITLSDDEKLRHTGIVRPLITRMLGGIPVLDWSIDSQLKQTLEIADLILVDSPYYTPFRESTLWSSLSIAKGAIIVIDDTRIPTLRKFCDRLAKNNPSLFHARIEVGHTFDIFCSEPDEKIFLKHSLIDYIKGWRRYLLGQKFYFHLK